MSGYRAEPCYKDGNTLVGNKEFYQDGPLSTVKPLGHRCDKIRCVSFNAQCTHELVIDQDVILEKWQTRFWNNSTYKRVYGQGNHLPLVTDVQVLPSHSVEADEQDQNLDQDRNLGLIVEYTSDGE